MADTLRGRRHTEILALLSKFAIAELHERASRRIAADFLGRLIEAAPCRIQTVLTDNGTHFTDAKGDGWRPVENRRMLADGEAFRCHGFELACAQNGIDHRRTRPNHLGRTARSSG